MLNLIFITSLNVCSLEWVQGLPICKMMNFTLIEIPWELLSGPWSRAGCQEALESCRKSSHLGCGGSHGTPLERKPRAWAGQEVVADITSNQTDADTRSAQGCARKGVLFLFSFQGRGCLRITVPLFDSGRIRRAACMQQLLMTEGQGTDEPS